MKPDMGKQVKSGIIDKDQDEGKENSNFQLQIIKMREAFVPLLENNILFSYNFILGRIWVS